MVKIQIIEKLFLYTLISSYLLLSVLFLFSKGKKNPIILLLLFYGLLYGLVLFFWRDFPNSYKKFLQTVYTLLEYLFFAYIFYYSIENKKLRRIIIAFSLFFTLFQFFFYFYFSLQKIDSVSIGLETIILFFFAVLYFQQYFKNNLTNNIYEYSSFWLVVGILIYLGSSFFFNILANHVTDQQFTEYWYLTFIPEIIKNILFGFVILAYPNRLISPRKPKPNSADIPNLDMI